MNRDAPGSQALAVSAEVMAVSDGLVVDRCGSLGGRRLDQGPTAWLRLDGRIDLVVITIRTQCLDTAQLEHLGIDVRGLRGTVVKSRGHFRAGFDDLFADDRVLEVDGPGLATPVLSRVAWTGVPRPIWPLDSDLDWRVPERVAV